MSSRSPNTKLTQEEWAFWISSTYSGSILHWGLSHKTFKILTRLSCFYNLVVCYAFVCVCYCLPTHGWVICHTYVYSIFLDSHTHLNKQREQLSRFLIMQRLSLSYLTVVYIICRCKMSTSEALYTQKYIILSSNVYSVLLLENPTWMEGPWWLVMGAGVGYDWPSFTFHFSLLHALRRKWQPLTPINLPGESLRQGNLNRLPSMGWEMDLWLKAAAAVWQCIMWIPISQIIPRPFPTWCLYVCSLCVSPFLLWK